MDLCTKRVWPASVGQEAPQPERTADRDRPFPDVVRIPTRVPFPVPPANAFLFLGKQPTLVDTGTGTDEGWEDLVQGLAAHGLKPQDIKRVLLSHHHIDHAGNALRLREAGAEICVHKADAPPVAKWREVAPERNRAYGIGLLRAGVPEDILEKINRRGKDVDVYMDSCPVDHELEDGEQVPAGDRVLTVMHTPGHTAGSAVYLDPDQPLVATGDTLLERITPNALTVRREEAGALATYLKTLKRLEETELGVVLPGHGVPFTGSRFVIERAFRHYHERRTRILDHLREADDALTVWDLVGRLWPDPSRRSAFLMVSEVLGHLELLLEAGEAEVQEKERAPAAYTSR